MGTFDKTQDDFLLSDIQGFIYGGQSSRFWMLRKFINSFQFNNLDNIPFYPWQCITLQFKHREEAFVIEDEKNAFYMIEYLLYELNSIDGIRDTAVVNLKKI